jgi:hypothetical protein
MDEDEQWEIRKDCMWRCDADDPTCFCLRAVRERKTENDLHESADPA